MLPAGFADLEPFLAWSEERDDERTQRRLRASVEEVTALYEAVLPRFPAIMAHLGGVDPRTMGDADRTLLCLSVAFVEAADTVEYYVPAGMNGPEDLLRFTSAHDLLGIALSRSRDA